MFRDRHERRPDAPPFPSPAFRYCTSAKVAQIDKHLRQLAGTAGIVINVMGLRAEESPARAKKPIWSERESVTTKKRQAYNWNPIHTFTTEEVWAALGMTLGQLQQVREQVKAIRMAGGTIQQALTETGFRMPSEIPDYLAESAPSLLTLTFSLA